MEGFVTQPMEMGYEPPYGAQLKCCWRSDMRAAEAQRAQGDSFISKRCLSESRQRSSSSQHADFHGSSANGGA